MGSNGVPFGGKGRPINPRFNLNSGPEGVETEDFTPKRNSGSFPERIRRDAPKPFGQSENSGPVFIPSGSNDRRPSPNSLFSEDEDGLSLDIGVNETETDSSPSYDVPRSTYQPEESSKTSSQTGCGTSFGFDGDDDLSLDVGVNETETAPRGEDYAAKEQVREEVPEVPKSVLPTLPVIPHAPITEEEESADDLSLDTGVNENEDSASHVVESVPDVPAISEPVKPSISRPAPPRPRSMNPMFADPVEEDEDDDLSLDVGVNETETKQVKRVVSPLFDFKSDGTPAPKRKPEARRMRPDSMIDTGDVDSFEESKPTRKTRKKDEPTRRPFQIQERDITLLRFLTKYQFSYVDALARVLDSTPQSMNKRLRTLEEYELVKRQTIAAGSTLWQARKGGIELAGMNFKENKRLISLATIRHTIGLVNLAAELEREAPGAKDILGLSDKFGEMFPVKNRFPGGIRLFGDEALETPLNYGEMTVSEREIRQGQKRYRGGRSSAEMRDVVDFAILNPEAPELEPGNEGLFVVYGHGGKTGEHVPDLVVTRPRDENGKPQHFAIELELTPKSPADWKRILRSYRENGGMYSRIYYFTSDRPIANMIRNADEEVGLGERLVLRKYTPKNKRQPFLG